MSIETYTRALQSDDPQKRRQAIVALGKSGDQRALKPLADTYKNDSDPQLRELALKAGRHLRKELSSVAVEAEPATSYGSTDSGGGFAYSAGASYSSASAGTYSTDNQAIASAKDEVPDWMHQMGGERPAPKPVSDRDRARAASYVDRAMDASVRGEAKKVVDLLEKALDINPALEKDGRTLGLLAMAFGTSSDQAVAALRAKRGGKAKGADSTDQGEWSEISDFFVEMGIWLLLIGLIATGVLYAMITSIDWHEVAAEVAAEGADPATVQFYQDLAELFANEGPRLAVQYGFFYSIALVISTTIFSSFIWIVGTFMGGSGILFKFITSTFRAIAVIIFVSTLISVLSVFATPGSVGAVLLGLAPIGFGMIYMGYAVGKAHQFGTAMGCVNLIVLMPACIFVWCMLSFIMGL